MYRDRFGGYRDLFFFTYRDRKAVIAIEIGISRSFVVIGRVWPSIDIQSQARVKKMQYGRQMAILKVASLKINSILPMATVNMYMKFEIEFPPKTLSPTDGWTDRWADRVIPVYPYPLKFRWAGVQQGIL